MFRFLMFSVMAMVLWSCGGGSSNGGSSGGNGGERENRGLEKIVAHHNSLNHAYKVNNLEISGSNSERNVFSECRSVNSIAIADLGEDVSEVSDSGACFDGYSMCKYITGSAMLTTTAFDREFNAITPSGDFSEVVIADVLLTGSFLVSAGQAVQSCDDAMDVNIPELTGVYEGYRYDIDDSKTLDKQSLIRSGKITMDCLSSICVPRDDSVIQVMTSNGFNLSAGNHETGPLILTQFSTPDNTRGYQFWGTSTDDGDTVTGLAFPVGTGAGYRDCYNGDCFFLAFHRVQ